MMFLATFLLAGWLGQGCSEHQQRNPSAKKYQHHNKPKLHYSSHVPHLETKYGIDLPSFAFDYSEYFSGAVIERSSRSKDLYLTMFVMGHQAISTDFPFQAISTDEEVLHSWTKATKKWEKPLAESLTTTKTSLSRRQLSTPSNSLSQQSFHATYSSGLVCLLKNNDIPHSQVYQSTAYWVQSQSDMDSSSGHNIFSILRCKLRNTAHFYQNSTHITEKQLFADVMRMLPHKSRGNHTATGGGDGGAKALPTASADGDIARDSRGTVLSSFSVPWSTRVVGYPLAFHSNNLHPLFESVSRHHHVSSPATGAVTSGAPAVSSAGQHSTNVAGAVTRAGTGAPGAGAAVGVDSSAVLCVPGVRPLHPLRAEVGLPMLVEFVEHHLLLGYQHIVFGIALDW